jgi:hypothetical protein
MNAAGGLNSDAISSWVGVLSVANDSYHYKNAEGQRIQSDSVAINIGIQARNAGSVANNAKTLIHELGHVFNMLTGAGGSMFAYDVDPVTGAPNMAAEAFNASLEQTCIR